MPKKKKDIDFETEQIIGVQREMYGYDPTFEKKPKKKRRKTKKR